MQTPSYELKVNAYTAGELSHLVDSLAKQLVGKVQEHNEKHPAGLTSEAAINVQEEIKQEEAKDPKPEETKEPAKRGRKAKTEVVERELTTEEVKTLQKEGEDITSGTTDEPITKEQIAQALQRVSEKVNFQKAKEILTSYLKEDGSPCKKVSDVLPKDYEAFMNSCRNSV